jgi:type I restriction enzyme, S subunit
VWGGGCDGGCDGAIFWFESSAHCEGEIMSFPRYSKYKDSGVEWLGEVPDHWEVKRLKRACTVFPSNVDKKSHEGETPIVLCNYTDVYYNETITPTMAFMEATASPEQIARFTLSAGDTIITKDSETADDIAIAAYVPQDLPGVVCGYHLSMVRPLAGAHGAFAKRLFDSVYAKSCFAVLAKGLTRVGLGQYELDNVDLPFPSMLEQTQIAAFLDRETAKIDALVAEQERLIELLKEKRQAVISHAVTKGLNPNAPMKPSGIEWLGDVPAHWEVVKMKWIAKMQSGHTPDKKVSDYWENGSIPWVSLNDTGFLRDHDYISETAYNITDLGMANSSAHLLPPRAVVFSRDATIGRCAITTIEMAVSQHFIAWICGRSMLPEFLLLRLRSMTDELEHLTTGATLKTIGMPTVRTMVTPVPPLKEQGSIVDSVQSRVKEIDALTAEAQRAIDLLQERRTALISAAVTGQIDVRQISEDRAA